MSLVQRRDISAFEELFRRYEQRVFAFLWRLSRNRPEAEDGTQETFLRLWKAANVMSLPASSPRTCFRSPRIIFSTSGRNNTAG